MDRSKSRLIYGLCLVAPVLAGGRPDGKDDGGHANLPFSLSAATPATSAAPTPAPVPAKESFSVIASMEHSHPAMTSAAPGTVNTAATSAAAASSVIVIPIRPSNAPPEDGPRGPKATPVHYTGRLSIVAVTSGMKSVISLKATPATASVVSPATTFSALTDANGRMTGMTAMSPKATMLASVAPSKSGSTVVIVPGKTAASSASGASSAVAPTPIQSAGPGTPVVSHNGASTLQTAGFALLAGMLGLVATLI